MSQLNFYVIPFLAFVLVANPATYKAVRRILGSWVSSAEGLATFPGLLLHALVFVLLAGFLMRVVPRVSGFDLKKMTGRFDRGKKKEAVMKKTLA